MEIYSGNRLLQMCADRLDKSSKKRHWRSQPEDNVSSPRQDDPSPEDDEGADGEPPVLGCTASEALKIEVLDNLPNDLARLFYLASLFDRTAYVDHSRAQRFGVESTAKAALRAHQEVFQRLTEARLEDVAKLLFVWADAEPEGFANVIREWLANQTYRLLAPPTAEQGERQLLENNLKLAIELVSSKVRGKTKVPRGD